MYEVKIPNVVFRSLLRSMAFGPILVCNPTGFCSIRESITNHGLYCRAKITHGETKQALIFTESSKILHDYIFMTIWPKTKIATWETSIKRYHRQFDFSLELSCKNRISIIVKSLYRFIENLKESLKATCAFIIKFPLKECGFPSAGNGCERAFTHEVEIFLFWKK